MWAGHRLPKGLRFPQPFPRTGGPSGPLALTDLYCWLDTGLASYLAFFFKDVVLPMLLPTFVCICTPVSFTIRTSKDCFF